MPFAAAVSEHPDPAEAIADVIGRIDEQLAMAPDLAVLTVSPGHVDAFPRMCTALRELLQTDVLIGCTAETVISGERELEGGPAISLWTATDIGPVEPVRIQAGDRSTGGFGVELPDAVRNAPDESTLILLADPFTTVLDTLTDAHPNLPVLGGFASAAAQPGGNRLVLDGEVHTDGAVGVLLGPEARLTTVVSQGCRPVGNAWTVTSSERNLIHELGGAPAIERIQAMVADLSPADRQLVSQGLHVGLVIDEHLHEFSRGDFLIRGLMGADQQTGAIAVGDEVPVGATVQFQVRDQHSATEDLRELLTPCRAAAALIFTCNGRGTRMFDAPDHDAELVSTLLDTEATGGMSCAGEIGPVGGRTFLHGFTASIALFGG